MNQKLRSGGIISTIHRFQYVCTPSGKICSSGLLCMWCMFVFMCVFFIYVCWCLIFRLKVQVSLSCYMVILCRQGKCRLKVGGAGTCEVGLRRRTYHVLSGSVLGVWTHVEGVFARHTGHNNRMQIARVRANKRLVGKRIG